MALTPSFARWLALGCVALVGVLFSRASAGNVAVPPGLRDGCWFVVVLTLVLSRGAGEDAVAARTSALAVVTARVESVPVATSSPKNDDRNGPERLRTTFKTLAPDLYVVVNGDARWLRPGYLVELRGRLSPPRSFANPGADSGAPHAMAVLAVPAPQLVRVVDDDPFSCGWIDGFVFVVRYNVDRLVRRLYRQEFRGSVLALLLGDRRELDPELIDALQATGTLHFLAISGLHAGILLALLLRAPLGRWGRAMRIAFIVLFALVTGAAPPILRTSLMVIFGAVAGLCGRTLRPIDGLAWAVVVLLLHQPDLVFDMGFQLSAVAVFAIIEWSPRFEAAMIPRLQWAHELSKALEKRRPANLVNRTLQAIAPGPVFLVAMLSASIAVSLAASLGTAPVLLYHFQRLHPLTPIWNLFLLPLVAVALICGFASVLAGWWHPFIGYPFAWVAEISLKTLRWLVESFAALPGSCVHLPRPPLWALLAAAALISLGAWALPRQWWPTLTRQRRHYVALAIGIVTVGIVTHELLRAQRVPRLWPRVHFLDVGAGSATVIVCPDGATILIDAGSNDARRTIGKRLAQSLLSLGIRHLDALVLTHKDADHVNGVDALSNTLAIGTVWVSPFFDRSAEGAAVVRRLRARGLRVRKIGRGDRLAPHQPDPGWTLDVLHPARGESLPLIESANDRSLVLRLTVSTTAGSRDGVGRILFPADIEEKGTARLLSYDEDLAAQILVAPHHGGKNPLFDILLDHVRPRWCVISANERGHAPRIIDGLKSLGIRCHATWRDGAGVATFDGRGWTVEAPFR